ncbi:hypothetical protein EYF80_040664 [Liparis tanakae]|uniref:Uncharacterized protein n=1 Tax=Liparis tanakae TaxID=230148 RepID=A0A4Z2G9A9_9TELE|nr:hypothetical protein EYF80_040664 [Liparis tanakae]
MNTLHAHRSFAAVAVHAEVLRFVVHACRRFPRGRGRQLTAAAAASASSARRTCRSVRRRHQAVLGERTAGRTSHCSHMTVASAGLRSHSWHFAAVEDEEEEEAEEEEVAEERRFCWYRVTMASSSRFRGKPRSPRSSRETLRWHSGQVREQCRWWLAAGGNTRTPFGDLSWHGV